MKIEHHFDNDGWLQMTLVAETPQDSTSLVRYGLNARAEAKKVSDVFAGTGAISAHIYLKTRKCGNTGYLNSLIRNAK